MTRVPDWLKISLILCTFGFFREMRPSEPFVVEFLSGKWRNVTAEQVNRVVYPWGTYSYMAQLVIVFLVTDILRYKPIIVMSACIGVAMWSLLLWTYTLEGLKGVQICFGFFMSAEVAYYTYIYAKVDREKYQQVTGNTRCAILFGKFLAGLFAQLLISFYLMDVRELNYISLAAQIISLPVAIMLPSVGKSLYFYAPVSKRNKVKEPPETELKRTANNTFEESLENSQTKSRFSGKKAVQLLWNHFTTSYTNSIVLQWSVWWALATCGFVQVSSYIQVLWKDIDPHGDNIYNGAVEATLTLLGATGAFAAGFLNTERHQRLDMWLLALCSLVEGGLVCWAALSNSVWVAYGTYIIFGTIFHFMITVASAIIAKHLVDDSFGLIFGVNTLVALAIQTIFTIVVISESGFALNPRTQFLTFAGYFTVLSVIYTLTAVYYSVKHFRQRIKPS